MGKASRMKQVRKLQKKIFLKIYETVAAPIYKEHFTPNCCLNATRVFLDVAQHFGIPARPLATQAAVFNPKFWELLMKNERFPKDREELLHWTDDLGGWSMGIGPTEEDGWQHHMIALSGKVIIDSSSRQFQRPAKNLMLPDIFIGEPKMMSGKMFMQSPDGSVISYAPEPAVNDYQEISGFQRSSSNRLIASMVIRAMEKYKG